MGGPFPLTSGGTSVGIERPAGDAYLLALPLLLGRIEAAVWWLGALGVVAVALTYALGRRAGGPTAGPLAALYMAANPWLVLYDRKLWSHIQVVFSVALLLLAWEIVVRGRRRATLWFVILATLQSLTHVLSLLQVLSWLSALLVAPRRWLNRAWLLGLGIGALLLAPYVAGLLTGPGAVGSESAAPALTTNFSVLAVSSGRNLAQALTLFGGFGLNALAGASPQGIHLAAQWIGWLVVGLVLFGALLSLRDLRSLGRAGLTARLLLAWAALPLCVLLFAPAVYQQYWTVLLPLPALYFGAGAAQPLRPLLVRALRPGRGGPRRFALLAAAAAAVLLVLVVWLGSYADLMRSVEVGRGVATFGVPLRRWQQAASAAIHEAQAAGAAGIRVAAQGVDPRYETEPAVIAALLHGRDDARLVVPGWPYLALVDPRYESDNNVIATEARRQNGGAPAGVTPGASLLDETRPTVFLWVAGDPGIEEVVARVGRQVWEGHLAEGRPPARVYVLPSRTELAGRAAETALRLVGDAGTGRGIVVVDEPDSPVLAALPAGTTAVIPPAANDRAAAEAAVAALTKAGARRVVLVEQPSGWWDADVHAKNALQAAYVPAGSWPEQVWNLHVYVLPGQLRPAGITFEGGPRLDSFALDVERVPPGGLIVLQAAWSAAESLPPGLKVSFQLLGPDGAAVAQVDRDLAEPDAGSLVHTYSLRLPGDLPEGDYRLMAVVYDGATGRRLPVSGSDAAELASVSVSEQPAP